MIIRYKINLMYPAFLMGVVCHGNYDFIKRRSVEIMIASGFIFMTMLSLWDETFWKYQEVWSQQIVLSLRESVEYYFQIYYRLIIGLAGSLFFFSLFETVFKSSVHNKFLSSLARKGQETLGIYLIQTLLLSNLMPKLIPYHNGAGHIFNFVITPILSLIVFLICLGIIRLIKLNPVTSYLLLGQKISRS